VATPQAGNWRAARQPASEPANQTANLAYFIDISLFLFILIQPRLTTTNRPNERQ
jgi:hypothetical protein